MNSHYFTFEYGGRVYEIPSYMREGLRLYVANGCPPGSFLRAVLENDLMRALGQADDTNMANLPAYGNFLYNHVPVACYGSPEKVREWIEHHGLSGLKLESCTIRKNHGKTI
jgi:hypothetical protein